MSLESLSAPQIRHILSLLEKKESLEAEIAKINSELTSLESPKAESVKSVVKRRGNAKKALKAPVEAPVADKPALAPKAKPAKKAAGKSSKRGGVREAVLAILEKAGKEGATVLDIAKTLAAKPGNLHVWFATTGKKITGISKVGPGKYALKS